MDDMWNNKNSAEWNTNGLRKSGTDESNQKKWYKTKIDTKMTKIEKVKIHRTKTGYDSCHVTILNINSFKWGSIIKLIDDRQKSSR